MRNYNVQKNEFIIIFIKNDTYDKKKQKRKQKFVRSQRFSYTRVKCV